MKTIADIQNSALALGPWKAFAVRFLCLAGLFFLLLELAPPAFYHGANRLNTVLTAHLMHLAGVRPIVHNTRMTLNAFTVNVIGECSAIFLLALLTAFILAYPAAWRQRLAGLITCVPSVMLANVGRIALVFYVGSQHRPLFKPLHLYFGQVLMILVVLAVVQIWLRRVSKAGPTTPLLSFSLRFVLFASPLFLAWLWVSPAYVDLATALVHRSLVRLELLTIPRPAWSNDPAIPITFNLVVYGGLILATRRHRLRPKAIAFTVGVLALVAGHLLLKAGHMIFLQHQSVWLMRTLNAWLLVNQWLLPVGGWLLWRTRSRQGNTMGAGP